MICNYPEILNKLESGFIYSLKYVSFIAQKLKLNYDVAFLLFFSGICSITKEEILFEKL